MRSSSHAAAGRRWLPNSFWETLPQLERDLADGGRTGARVKQPKAASQMEMAASQIIREANEAALMIVAKAEAEADSLREDARRIGYEEGLEVARKDVEARLTAEFEMRIENLRADLDKILETIETQRVELWKNAEKEILAFSLDIARKVIKTEVHQEKTVVLEVIRQALRRVVDKDQVRIRINPADIELVRAQREDLMLVLDGARNLEIIDDRRIEAGGCVVETSAGTIDAKIDTQFEVITHSLGIGE